MKGIAFAFICISVLSVAGAYGAPAYRCHEPDGTEIIRSMPCDEYDQMIQEKKQKELEKLRPKVTQEPPKVTVPPSTKHYNPADDLYDRSVTINKNGYFGCSSKAYMEKLISYATDRDEQAFHEGLSLGVLTRQCAYLNRGDRVYVMGYSLGLVRVRMKGSSNEYWTFDEAIK